MPCDLIDDKSTLTQVCLGAISGNKPLPEPVLSEIYDARSRPHWVNVSVNVIIDIFTASWIAMCRVIIDNFLI